MTIETMLRIVYRLLLVAQDLNTKAFSGTPTWLEEGANGTFFALTVLEAAFP
jgi:hypothetical protein